MINALAGVVIVAGSLGSFDFSMCDAVESDMIEVVDTVAFDTASVCADGACGPIQRLGGLFRSSPPERTVRRLVVRTRSRFRLFGRCR